MQRKKDVLTTGQVAKICSVAPRTVTKWFDSGQLKGYRIPGSKDRRIPTSELIRFMKANHMPTDELEAGRTRILIIDNDSDQSDALADSIAAKGSYQIKTANNSFDAGLIAQKMLPHIIMINLMAPDIDAAQVCTYVKSNGDLTETKIMAIANSLGPNEKHALFQKGFDAVIDNTDDTLAVIKTIHELTSIIS